MSDTSPTPSRWPLRDAMLKSRDDARRAEALRRRALADRLAEILVSEFGVESVVLFGSLARGEWRGRCDIDLAVRGLSPDMEFRALGRLLEVAGVAVDLVLLESATPRLLEAVARDGVKLDVPA